MTSPVKRCLPWAAFLAALTVAAATAAAQQRSPQQDIWVAYEPFFELWERDSPGHTRRDLIVTHGHGRPPIFSIRLDSTHPLRARIRTPANLDGHDLHATPPESSEPDDAFEEADSQRDQLVLALRHHWPAVGLTVDHGRAQLRETTRSRWYQLCSGRRLREFADRLAAAADTTHRRERALRYRREVNERPRSPIAAAGLFIQLLSLGLPPVENGRLMQNARRRLMERQASDSPSQYSLRDPIMVGHGQEYEQHVDLMADRLSARARICQMVPLTKIQDAATDRCRIAAVVDRRDGWPLFISIRREKIAADGAREGRVDFFSRIVPLEGFVAPPNPCPSS